MGLSGSQVCWTAPAARASLILCLWDLQSLGLEGVAGHWDHLGQGRVCRPGDPAATHVSLILTWDELIVDSFILGACGEAWPFRLLDLSVQGDLFLWNSPLVKGSLLGSQVFFAFCCCQGLVEMPGMGGGVSSNCTRMEPHQAWQGLKPWRQTCLSGLEQAEHAADWAWPCPLHHPSQSCECSAHVH